MVKERCSEILMEWVRIPQFSDRMERVGRLLVTQDHKLSVLKKFVIGPNATLRDSGVDT